MRGKTLAQRYIGRTLYDGDLVDEPLIDWLVHEQQPAGLAFPCFLPECQKLVMRTSERGGQAYFCDPKHTRLALARRRKLLRLVDGLSVKMRSVPVNESGKPTTGRGRALQADLDFARNMLVAYAGAVPESHPER